MYFVYELQCIYVFCFLLMSGMVAALTNESATSKSVYFAHCTSEMIFITHLLAEEPEKLAGPLLADTYVTLLKGRNAWYGQMLAKGELSPDMGDSIRGKGMIQVLLLYFYFLVGSNLCINAKFSTHANCIFGVYKQFNMHKNVDHVIEVHFCKCESDVQLGCF